MQRQAAFANLIFLILSLFAARAHAAERAKLVLGYSTTGPTAVGLWMAKDSGAFR